jgi:EAL domain-containing protein (putative c-di-GMP-specific phosphodiesterase class I)
VDEVQLFTPGWSHPSVFTTQQALIQALIELAHARDLMVSVRGVQQQDDLQGFWQRGVNLASGPRIGGPVLEISELLVKQTGNNKEPDQQ